MSYLKRFFVIISLSLLAITVCIVLADRQQLSPYHTLLKQLIKHKPSAQTVIYKQQTGDHTYFSDDPTQGQKTIIDMGKLTTFSPPPDSKIDTSAQSHPLDPIENLRRQQAQATAQLQHAKDLRMQQAIEH